VRKPKPAAAGRQSLGSTGMIRQPNKRKENKIMANEIDTATLVKRLANATKTYYGCSGHYKSARNEWLMKEYQTALEQRGAEIPTLAKLLEIGQFNGSGSF